MNTRAYSLVFGCLLVVAACTCLSASPMVILAPFHGASGTSGNVSGEDLAQWTEMLRHVDADVAVEVMGNGWSMIPADHELLKSPRAPAASEADSRRLVALAKSCGKRYGLAFDLLQWADAGAKPESFANRGLLELDNRLLCSGENEGLFVSPLNQSVRQYLRRSLLQAISSYPDARFVLVKCRLARFTLLGFSEATRQASIAALHLDPVDLPLGSLTTDRYDELDREWLKWRSDAVTELLSEMMGEVRKKAPGIRVIGIVHPTIYSWPESQRYFPAQDWQAWLKRGLFDEVLFDDVWNTEQAAWTYTEAQRIAKQAAPGIACRPLIRVRESSSSLDKLAVVWGVLNAQDAPEPAVYVQSSSELKLVTENWKLFEPRVK